MILKRARSLWLACKSGSTPATTVPAARAIVTPVEAPSGSRGTSTRTRTVGSTAVPQTVGKTGHRGFCMDMSGEIKTDPAGGTNCTIPIS